MRPTQPRLAPLPPDQIPEEILKYAGGGPGKPVLNIYATVARHPKLAKRWLVFGSHVLGKSTLSARERELVILRTGHLCKSAYEWGQHVRIGKAAGLTDAEIQGIMEGPDAPGWDAFDAVLLRAADELHADSCISDSTWQALAARYSEQQLLDLIFAIGQYTLVCMALNSLGVQLER
ncbi:MAG TPA: carboxymuconolactone decarboxylase family protein [Polyangiales bacterium]|nr:carboxymuconolactone decarboxylase family protein [Polyangiales bacterium]